MERDAQYGYGSSKMLTDICGKAQMEMMLESNTTEVSQTYFIKFGNTSSRGVDTTFAYELGTRKIPV